MESVKLTIIGDERRIEIDHAGKHVAIRRGLPTVVDAGWWASFHGPEKMKLASMPQKIGQRTLDANAREGHQVARLESRQIKIEDKFARQEELKRQIAERQAEAEKIAAEKKRLAAARAEAARIEAEAAAAWAEKEKADRKSKLERMVERYG